MTPTIAKTFTATRRTLLAGLSATALAATFAFAPMGAAQAADPSPRSCRPSHHSAAVAAPRAAAVSQQSRRWVRTFTAFTS